MQIRRVKESLLARKAVIDFESLGRTLAYSPFLPRLDREKLMRTSSHVSNSVLPKIALQFPIYTHYKAEELLYRASEVEKNAQADMLLLDLCMQYEGSEFVANESILALESISLLRRHTRLPLVCADIFLDKYQILEAALFGADALLFRVGELDSKNLRDLLEFASRLYLEVFVEVDSRNGLKEAIFSGARMLYMSETALKELLEFVPNTQVIASDSMQDYGVDLWLRK